MVVPVNPPHGALGVALVVDSVGGSEVVGALSPFLGGCGPVHCFAPMAEMDGESLRCTI